MKGEELYNQYIMEKSMLEQYGHTSVLTYEKWKSLKRESTARVILL